MKDTKSTSPNPHKGATPMPGTNSRNRRYMPGLDGLRALSVLAVIAYHLNLGWAPGGLLGVGIFFVLSGYLITDQLLSERQRFGKIDLAEFWVRRARRLLPAMFLMLAGVALWLTLFDRARLAELQGDFVSAIFYFNNWWLIFHEVSYFESFGPPSPIGHLWSLAIEEQFYLLWPLLLVFGLYFAKRRGRLIALLLIGALASTLAMALLYIPGLDPSRVYYGTDTRVFALLIGAALAVAWPSERLGERTSRRSIALLDGVGAISLGLIVWMIAESSEYGQFLYYGGLLLLSALSALAIAALAHPSSLLARLMGIRPLRWIGVRSYSLYIWHYPVIVLTTPEVDAGEFNAIRVSLQIAASLTLASLSWKFVEEPIRRGALAKLRERIRLASGQRRRTVWGMALCGLCLLAISFNGAVLKSAAPILVYADSNNLSEGNDEKNPGAELPVSGDPEASEPEIQKPETGKPGAGTTGSNPTSTEQPGKELPKPGSSHVGKPPVGKPSDDDSSKPNDKNDLIGKSEDPAGTKKPQQPGSGAGNGNGITAIGDSVILDAAPYLEKLLPGISVDGKIGRQMTQAQDVVDAMIASGKLGDRVVIELGTNGSFNSKQLRKLIETIGEKREILLVNVRVPRKWQDTVNTALEKAASDYDNVKLIDWFTASKDKDDFFYKDGVHLKREGAEFYASMLTKELGMASAKPQKAAKG